MGMPSIEIDPLAASISLIKARANEDFPAPVRPTIPIWDT